MSEVTQHVLNVITEATTHDLVTLDEMKLMLRIPTTDTSKDPELAIMIDGVSAQMATFANRVFGYEEVHETFYDIVPKRRLFFSRWPVKLTDIQTMSLSGVDVLGDGTWVLEEKKGILYTPQASGRGQWAGDLDVVYSGGYKLPDEAPDDLKRAAAAAIREDYYTFLRGAILSGVRMIAHKQARVMYYPPGQIGATLQTSVGPAGSSATWNSVMAVLNHYIRHWV